MLDSKVQRTSSLKPSLTYMNGSRKLPSNLIVSAQGISRLSKNGNKLFTTLRRATSPRLNGSGGLIRPTSSTGVRHTNVFQSGPNTSRNVNSAAAAIHRKYFDYAALKRSLSQPKTREDKRSLSAISNRKKNDFMTLTKEKNVNSGTQQQVEQNVVDEELRIRKTQMLTEEKKSTSEGHLPHPPAFPQPKDLVSKRVVTPKKKAGDDEVVIHVFDETNNVNKDFVCKRDLLLREMKYFRTYITDNCSFEDIDISVHCDINIFQWLMDYINKRDGKTPQLDIAWAISILISSDFLEMDELVETTLKFVRDNLQQIIKLPIELECINMKLLGRLSEMFTDEELDNIRDKKDKIVSKLFMHKISKLLDEPQNTLFQCALCSKVFAKSQSEWLICKEAKIYIDFHGRVVAQHVIDETFDVNKYLVKLKKTMSWRKIYWRIWGLTHSFHCNRCNTRFQAAYFGHCSYHPGEPVFEPGHNVGKYQCCNKPALRFHSGLDVQKGCRAKNHLVTPQNDQETNDLAILLRRNHNILIPFEEPQEVEVQNKENPNHDLDFLDDYTTDDEGEDSDSSDTKIDFPGEKDEVFTTFSRKFCTNPMINVPSSTPTRKKKHREIGPKMNGPKRRFWLMDKQREADRQNIDEIQALLLRNRKDKKKVKKKKKKKPV